MADKLEVSLEQPPKEKLSTRLRRWLGRHRLLVGTAGVVCLVLAAGLAYSYLLPADESGPTLPIISKPSPTPVPKDQPNPLNGVLYTKDEAATFANIRPIAVMVENHRDSRPQSGLNEADVIYEAMAEGGITRFMPVYLAGRPEKIGPVRSARQHFIDWASELDAIYAHWGGSTEALAYLRTHSVPKDLDQFQHAGAFYRDRSTGKSLEHTGYTSTDLLRNVASRNRWEQAVTFDRWTFQDGLEASLRPASQVVRLGFLGTTGYDGRFVYRPESNDYVRWTGGVEHLDSRGDPLTATTIVILFHSVVGYTDTSGHAAVRVTTTGSGRAMVVQNGQVVEGSWRKTSQLARTVLTDTTGQPLALSRGKLWIVSAPIGSDLTFE